MDLALIVWAHLTGDYLMQTHEVSQRKPHDARAMATHIATYHLPMGLVAVWLWGPTLPAAVFLTISAVTHAFFDLRWPITGLMRLTGSAAFATWPNGGGVGLMIFDQWAHLSALLAGYAAALTLTT